MHDGDARPEDARARPTPRTSRGEATYPQRHPHSCRAHMKRASLGREGALRVTRASETPQRMGTQGVSAVSCAGKTVSPGPAQGRAIVAMRTASAPPQERNAPRNQVAPRSPSLLPAVSSTQSLRLASRHRVMLRSATPASTSARAVSRPLAAPPGAARGRGTGRPRFVRSALARDDVRWPRQARARRSRSPSPQASVAASEEAKGRGERAYAAREVEALGTRKERSWINVRRSARSIDRRVRAPR